MRTWWNNDWASEDEDSEINYDEANEMENLITLSFHEISLAFLSRTNFNTHILEDLNFLW